MLLEVDGCNTFLQMFCKCFILRVSTANLQHALNMLKHLQNVSATFLHVLAYNILKTF